MIDPNMKAMFESTILPVVMMFPDDELVKLRALIDVEFDREYERRNLTHTPVIEATSQET